MGEHPNLEALALWVVSEPEVFASDRAHFERCPRCRETAADLRRLTDLANKTITTEPRRAAVERASTLVGGSAPRPVERELIEAELVEDTEVLVGVRGEATEGRILVFRAGECDVHVQMLRLEDGIRTRFLGQVLGTEDHGLGDATVRILHGDDIVAESMTDDLGEFHVAADVRFPLRLEIASGSYHVRTPPISKRSSG